MLARLSLQLEGVALEDVRHAISKSKFDMAPERTAEIYGTDYPFKLSGVQKKKSPQAIAKELVELCSESEPFTVVDPGTGHLNGSPRKRAVETFQCAIETRGGEFFLGIESIFPSVDQTDCLPPVSPKEMLRNLQRQIQKSRNEDVKAIARDEMPRSAAEIVMISALLSDDDLDSRAFLRRLQGRENVPWFFKQFISDVKSFVRQVPENIPFIPVPLSIEQLKLGAYQYQSRSPSSLQEVTQGFLIALFELRQHYFSAILKGSPVEWTAYLRELVKRFYAFYNIPHYRHPQKGDIGDIEYLQTLSLLLEALSRVMEAWLEQLSACEN